MALPTKKILIFLLLSGILTFSSCHIARYVFWNYADINDYKRFPADTLITGMPAYPFYPYSLPYKLILPESFQTTQCPQDLENFLESTHTKVFLIIRNDSIIYEKYFDDYNHMSLLPGFSIAKSFLSALVGIAIDEGFIKSTSQPVTDFIPEMKDTGFQKVTIDDLLSMRSGIRFVEGYSNPFSGVAKFYYGRNLRKYSVNLKVVSTSGNAYNYQSANYQLLAMIIEKATGKRVSEYLEEKIWKPVGMEFPGTWNYDSKKFMENKGFCCINARAVDFARFGELYLNGGILNDQRIISKDWVDASLNNRYNSLDSQGFPYTYSWRVLANGDFFAKGILGEYIYVSPAKKIIIVRIGTKAGDLIWPQFFQGIISQI